MSLPPYDHLADDGEYSDWKGDYVDAPPSSHQIGTAAAFGHTFPPEEEKVRTPAHETMASSYSSSHTVVPSGSVDRSMSPDTPFHHHGRSRSVASNAPLTYYDEEQNKYSNHKSYSDGQTTNRNTAPYGKYDPTFVNMDYADPYDANRNSVPDTKDSPFSRFIDSRRYPLDQRIENKKRGIGRQRYPFVAWALAVVFVGVFINELVVNWRAQGTPFSFHPTVNPMLGPSTSALIHVGARFVPCMKQVQGLPVNFDFPCLNNTANPPTSLCELSDVCGFGGFGKSGNEEPNQWFRFMTPIFLHAGLVHLALNLAAHLSISAQVEREMGSAGFFILYFAAGIFGNVLGANFALLGSPSTGASGAIFGTIAVEWVDLIFHWKLTYRPVRRLMFLIVDLIIGIAMGFIPFIDNFAHLGGLFMGLFAGIIFYPVISTTKRHKIITWVCRIVAIPLPIILFVILTRNFYTGDPYSACSGCRYLSCFPTNANNHCHGTGLTINGTQLNN